MKTIIVIDAHEILNQRNNRVSKNIIGNYPYQEWLDIRLHHCNSNTYKEIQTHTSTKIKYDDSTINLNIKNDGKPQLLIGTKQQRATNNATNHASYMIKLLRGNSSF